MVKIIVGNIYSKIVGFVPEDIQTALNDALSYKLEGAKFIPSVKSKQWDGVVRLYYNAKGQSFLTGLLAIVRELFKKRKFEYEILDRREKPDMNYPELAYSDTAKFESRDYQDFTIGRALKFTRGVLSVCTGGGKTIMVTRLIKEIQTFPFIFYVLSKDLMEQAHSVMSKFLNQPIGMIGDGKADIKKISVCTIQTAVMALNEGNSKFKISDYTFDDEDTWDEKGIEDAEKAAKIRKLINMAKGIYVDECLTGDTKVETEIGEITLKSAVENKCRFVKTYDGNNLVYKKILNWWDIGEKEVFKIRLKNGKKIKCTGNHLICTKRGWIQASKLLKNDNILFADVGVGSRFPTINIDQESMSSDIRLKRDLKKSGKKFIRSMLTNCHHASVDVVKKLFPNTRLSINLSKVKEIPLALSDISPDMISNLSGENIILNRLKKKDRQYLEHVLETRPYSSLMEGPKIIDYPPTTDLSKKNGQNISPHSYKGIGLDCVDAKIKDMVKNGLLCHQNVCLLSPKLPPSYMLARRRELLTKYWMHLAILGWHGGFAMMEAKTKNKEICRYISKDGVKKSAILSNLGLSKKATIALWLKTRGVINSFYLSEKRRLLSYRKGLENSYQNACNIKWQQVESILISEKEKVYDIEVADVHCFFANGMLVHNCHHVSARTVKEVLTSSPNAYWRFGGSATPNRESGDDIMIQALLGSKIVDISASYLIKRNWLVKPYIFFEPIEDNTSLNSYKKIYKTCVADNDKFNSHVAETAKYLVSKGKSVLILVQQYSQGDYIKTLIPDSEFLTGKITSKKRTEVIENLRQKKIMTMIATSLADEGLDIPNLDVVLIAGGGKSSTRLFQRIGRTLRKDKEGLKDRSIVVIYAHDAKYLSKHVQKVRSLLKREPEFVIKDSKGPNFIFDEFDVVLGLKDKAPDLFNT